MPVYTAVFGVKVTSDGVTLLENVPAGDEPEI